jgi:hypothetical protein
MSIATDFRAALTAHAGLTALVPASAIAENAAGEDATFPLIVFAVRLDNTVGLSGSDLGERAEISTQCWAADSAAAAAVAAQVRAALAAQALDRAIVINEQDAFDPDIKKHAQTLTVVWI